MARDLAIKNHLENCQQIGFHPHSTTHSWPFLPCSSQSVLSESATALPGLERPKPRSGGGPIWGDNFLGSCFGLVIAFPKKERTVKQWQICFSIWLCYRCISIGFRVFHKPYAIRSNLGISNIFPRYNFWVQRGYKPGANSVKASG